MAREDILIHLRVQVEEARKALKQVKHDVKMGTRDMYQLGAAEQVVKDRTDKLNAAMGKSSRAFQGWALSIMFAGMAVQRLFNGIARSGIKTFQDVMHSVEGSTTSFDMLNASAKYLGFTIGQALEPVIAFLIPIVDKIADWAAENPKIVAGIISLGAALGALMTVGGGLYLAIEGFKQLGEIMGAARIGSALAGLSVSTPWIAAILAAAAAAGLLAWNLSQNEEATDVTKKKFSELEEPLNDLKDTFIDLVNTIFDSNLASEDLAWVTAWALAVAVEGVKGAIKGFEGLLEAIMAVVNGLKAVAKFMEAVFYASQWDFEEMRKAFDAGKSYASSAWSNIKDSGSAFSQALGPNLLNKAMLDLIVQGPEGYKNANTNYQTSYYFGEINIEPRSGETSADVINRILQEQGAAR